MVGTRLKSLDFRILNFDSADFASAAPLSSLLSHAVSILALTLLLRLLFSLFAPLTYYKQDACSPTMAAVQASRADQPDPVPLLLDLPPLPVAHLYINSDTNSP